MTSMSDVYKAQIRYLETLRKWLDDEGPHYYNYKYLKERKKHVEDVLRVCKKALKMRGVRLI